jgi:hypothetical protein
VRAPPAAGAFRWGRAPRLIQSVTAPAHQCTSGAAQQPWILLKSYFILNEPDNFTGIVVKSINQWFEFELAAIDE